MARAKAKKIKVPDTLAHRVKTGRMIPCTGEAHSNPFIDNCMVCMPLWGVVEETADIDIAAAFMAGLGVPFSEMTTEQIKNMNQCEKDGLVTVAMERHGNAGFFVARCTLSSMLTGDAKS